MSNISVPVSFTAEITLDNLGYAVLEAALVQAGKPETADFDLKTDYGGNTYVDNGAWQISDDPRVATLVDAHYILLGEVPQKLTAAEVVQQRAAVDGRQIPESLGAAILRFPGGLAD